MTPGERIKELARQCREAAPITVLTGAGVSTESGIPDFRSPQTGIYARIDPMDYLSVDALRLRPVRFWKHFLELFVPAADALANEGHKALARLEEAGIVDCVITQNIDGLHQKAGSRNVIEIHGHMRTARCMSCEASYPMNRAGELIDSDKGFPTCTECGAMLRPDVVLFGDMPSEFDRAAAVASKSRLMLVVGSSLGVSPANMLVAHAEAFAIVNREPTPFDSDASVVIQGGAGETLGRLSELLLEERNRA